MLKKSYKQDSDHVEANSYLTNAAVSIAMITFFLFAASFLLLKVL